MSRTLLFVPIVLGLAISACQSNESSSDEIERMDGDIDNELVADESSNDTLPSIDWNFFEGTFGNPGQQVVLELGQRDSVLVGRYFFARLQSFIEVEGYADTTNDIIYLKENYLGDSTGTIVLVLNEEGELRGKWTPSQAVDSIPQPVVLRPMNLTLRDRDRMSVMFSKYEREHTITGFSGMPDNTEEEIIVDEFMLSAIDDRHFCFYYHVLGDNGHNGSLSGVATMVQQNYGIFHGNSSETGCLVSFKFKGDSLLIREEEDCSVFRDGNVGFSNRMKKVR